MSIAELVKIFWTIIEPDNKKRLIFVIFMQCITAVVENVMAITIASFASFSVNPQVFLENEKVIIFLSHMPFIKTNVVDIMLFLVVAMVVSVALKVVFSLSSEYLQSTLAEKISNDTAIATMKSLMAKSFSWHLSRPLRKSPLGVFSQQSL